MPRGAAGRPRWDILDEGAGSVHFGRSPYADLAVSKVSSNGTILMSRLERFAGRQGAARSGAEQRCGGRGRPYCSRNEDGSSKAVVAAGKSKRER